MGFRQLTAELLRSGAMTPRLGPLAGKFHLEAEVDYTLLSCAVFSITFVAACTATGTDGINEPREYLFHERQLTMRMQHPSDLRVR